MAGRRNPPAPLRRVLHIVSPYARGYRFFHFDPAAQHHDDGDAYFVRNARHISESETRFPGHAMNIRYRRHGNLVGTEDLLAGQQSFCQFL